MLQYVDVDTSRWTRVAMCVLQHVLQRCNVLHCDMSRGTRAAQPQLRRAGWHREVFQCVAVCVAALLPAAARCH